MIITNTPEETLAAFLCLLGIAAVFWIIYGVIRWHELRDGAPCVITGADDLAGRNNPSLVQLPLMLTERGGHRALDDGAEDDHRQDDAEREHRGPDDDPEDEAVLHVSSVVEYHGPEPLTEAETERVRAHFKALRGGDARG